MPRRSWPRPATRSRFATARALVKHAGLAPREKLSGTFIGRTKLTGQGRPGLRLAAWRAVWGAQRANPVYAARYRHLTTREHNKLTPTQAQTVIAAAILRHLHAVITTGQAWDPAIATHGTQPPGRSHSPPEPRQAALQAGGRGEPSAALRHPGDLDAHHGQPRPSSHQPDYTLPGTPRSPLCRDRRRTGTGQTLDAKRLTLMRVRVDGAPSRPRWPPASTYAPTVSAWTSLRTYCSAPCRWSQAISSFAWPCATVSWTHIAGCSSPRSAVPAASCP